MVFRDARIAPLLAIIPSGSFLMGSPPSEEGRYDNESPVHDVNLTRRFALGRYAVTFEEFDQFTTAVARSNHHDAYWGRGRRPVIHVSWQDAKDYVAWLSEQTGENYRLPSEAEWEYACRAGTQMHYWWGDTIHPNFANYYNSGIGRTVEVGSYPANSWRLHEMHGNVWEWCEDAWHETYDGAPTDGTAWLSDGHMRARCIRGGSHGADAVNLRAARRDLDLADNRNSFLTGFRVVRVIS